jgi:XTP/dITP diphosphohydrolase
MPKLLLASANPGKIAEYRFLLSSLDYQIITLAEQGILESAIESGSSYEENARLKATTYAKLSQLITIADDSGLEVDALGAELGIRSARFAGKDATDADKVKILLDRLDGIPWEKRTAHFKCVIAIVTPGGQIELCYGECHGIIAFEAKGENGFGYDPIFYLPQMAKTVAELPLEIKNQISHRAQAAYKARQVLQQFSPD